MAKILVIEDEKELLENLVFFLSLENYEVLSACDGKSGVITAFSELPDLIICDINMPEMDGFQVLNEIRANAATTTVPFIFLTARSDKADIRQGMDLGADDFVSKPYTDEEILNAVKTRLDKHKIIKDAYSSQMDELRQNIASTLPHELKTPLSVILAYSDILDKNYKDLTEDDIKNIAKSINAAGKRLHRLFENYIFYTSLIDFKLPENEQIGLKAKYAHQSLKKITDEVASRYTKGLKVINDFTPCDVNMLNSHFEKVIEELVDNAFKFSNENSLVEINSSVNDGKYEVRIKNVGIEFTKDQIQNIGGFMQFNRKYVEQQGIGLGLAIVNMINSLYGNELNINSFNGHTEIILNVPILTL